MAAAITRAAAKVLVLDRDGSCLLFKGFDPANPGAGTWWFPPGGGIEGNETLAEAAVRELFEETGLQVDDVGPEIFYRESTFGFMGKQITNRETYFAVRVAHFELADDQWTDDERASILEHRWWTAAQLRETTDTVFPAELLELVDGLNRGRADFD